MSAHAVKDMVVLKTCTATMEICVVVPQEDSNQLS